MKTDAGLVSALKLVWDNGNIANASVQFELNNDSTSAAKVDTTAADPRLYWQMPDALLTSLVSLYGTDVLFTVNFVIVQGVAYTDHKALLIARNGNVLVHPLFNVQQGNDSSLVVTLKEDGWRINGTGTVPTRGEFLKALSSARFLLLPASFSAGKETSR